MLKALGLKALAQAADQVTAMPGRLCLHEEVRAPLFQQLLETSDASD